MKKIISIILLVLVGSIFGHFKYQKNQENSYALQNKEAKRSIIATGKFQNLADTLTVRFRDNTLIKLVAEYDLDTFVYHNSKDIYLDQDQFMILMKMKLKDQLSSHSVEAPYSAFKLEVLKGAYPKNRIETIIQFFSDNTENIRKNSNDKYPGAIKTLKITVI